jgi:hypothetical protein
MPGSILIIRDLEARFLTLEQAAAVGIGGATGADKAFTGPFAELDVERLTVTSVYRNPSTHFWVRGSLARARGSAEPEPVFLPLEGAMPGT